MWSWKATAVATLQNCHIVYAECVLASKWTPRINMQCGTFKTIVVSHYDQSKLLLTNVVGKKINSLFNSFENKMFFAVIKLALN